MGKFDIREDEEQYAKQANCIELLNSAGYHRAKIQGLSAFDKVLTAFLLFFPFYRWPFP